MQRKLGGRRWLAIASVSLAALALLTGASSCRRSSPPKIDICLGDGVGGGDCLLREGSRLRGICIKLRDAGWYCPPSALENAWMTTQEDMAAYSSWCHDTSQKNVKAHMRAIREAVR